MIETANLKIAFGTSILLNDITVSFKPNTLTALIGRNGTGKSTFLKTVMGFNEKYSGKILINGADIKDLSPIKQASTLSFVNTQRPLVNNLKCRDVVALGRSPFTGWSGKLSENDKIKVSEALEIVGMKEYADRYLHTLSDGECQKIMIARAIAQDTPIILLDEPTSFLDLPTRFELIGMLRSLAENQNKTIIFSTHELDIALEMSHQIALINDGSMYVAEVKEMIESGRIQAIFKTTDNFINRYLNYLLSDQNFK